MPSPSREEPSNDQPEESMPALEVRPLARAERDLELVAQEQVLDHEVVALMEEGCQGGEEDAESVKHPPRVADRGGWSFALLQGHGETAQRANWRNHHVCGSYRRHLESACWRLMRTGQLKHRAGHGGSPSRGIRLGAVSGPLYRLIVRRCSAYLSR